MTAFLCSVGLHRWTRWIPQSWATVRFCRRPGCWAQEQRVDP